MENFFRVIMIFKSGRKIELLLRIVSIGNIYKYLIVLLLYYLNGKLFCFVGIGY